MRAYMAIMEEKARQANYIYNTYKHCHDICVKCKLIKIEEHLNKKQAK